MIAHGDGGRLGKEFCFALSRQNKNYKLKDVRAKLDTHLAAVLEEHPQYKGSEAFASSFKRYLIDSFNRPLPRIAPAASSSTDRHG